MHTVFTGYITMVLGNNTFIILYVIYVRNHQIQHVPLRCPCIFRKEDTFHFNRHPESVIGLEGICVYRVIQEEG